MTMKYTKIVIADDHLLVLQGFQQLLESEYHVVGTVQTGGDLLQKVEELHPDLVLLDIQMPDTDGFEIARKLKKQFPLLKIIFVTMRDEPTSIVEAFNVGAMGYVLKQSVTSDLVMAIQEVLQNRYYISALVPEEIRETILSKIKGMPIEGFSGRLTPQQREVLRLVAQGFTAKDIGSTLNITVSTVAFHKSNIMEKLGVKTKAELTKYAVAQGIASLKT